MLKRILVIIGMIILIFLIILACFLYIIINTSIYPIYYSPSEYCFNSNMSNFFEKNASFDLDCFKYNVSCETIYRNHVIFVIDFVNNCSKDVNFSLISLKDENNVVHKAYRLEGKDTPRENREDLIINATNVNSVIIYNKYDYESYSIDLINFNFTKLFINEIKIIK